MPATAGRVRMPANNRVHSSAALQTHGIWQSAIGYDPYAPSRPDPGSGSGSDTAYASFQGLLALARLTGSNASETRGACRKCGRVGHLTYQCRNFLTLKEEKEKENYDPALPLEEMIKELVGPREESTEEESSDGSSSDSDVDPEIERIIKKRYGWCFSKRVSVDDSDDDDEKRREIRKHRRREHGSSSPEEDWKERKRKRRERRRKRREEDVSSSSETGSDEERKRKKSRRHRKDRNPLTVKS